jgi:ribonuclease G
METGLTKDIIVNVGERETRIAVVEDGRLTELHIERGERIVGSLYKGRVENVLPGMDAAFVDIGLGRNAFLHVGDVLPTTRSDAGGRAAAEADDDDDEDTDGGNGHHRLMRRARRKQQQISQLLKRGQEILVQVTKGPRGSKGARVSTLISLPGRYLVLMPESDTVGVSRKVEERAERERLRRIGERLKRPGFGIILRTEAEDKAEADLAADSEYLYGLWEQILVKSRQAHGPTLIHRDLTLVSKAIRDIFGSDVRRLILDDPDEYEKVNELLANVSPKLRGRIQLYTGETPCFAHFGLEPEIERSLKRKVWLKSGGHLVFDVTEALTVIDVNTGKFTGGANLADTIVKTNIEAAGEIARQLRLRDIGGIIVIDFIDMASSKDRQQVLQTLETALRRDKARTKISSISALGLVEMTRKRTSETVADFLGEPCAYCGGRGSVPSAETVSMDIERDIVSTALGNQRGADAVYVECSPGAAELLIGENGVNVDRLEQVTRHAIYIRAKADLPPDRYEVRAGRMVEIERNLPALRRDQVVEGDVASSRLQPETGVVAWSDGLMIVLDDGRKFVGQSARVRLETVRRSWATGTLAADRRS